MQHPVAHQAVGPFQPHLLLSLWRLLLCCTHLLAGLCAPRFSSPPGSVHEVACSGVNFPTASSSILDSQRFVRLSFKTPFRCHFHTAFPDPLGRQTFSQTFIEYFPCAEHFMRAVSHDAHGSPKRWTLSLFLEEEAQA